MTILSSLKRTSLCLLVLSLAACNSTRRPPRVGSDYVLEPHPRAVLKGLGITPSASPRLGLSTSGEIYLLAAYGKGGRLGFFMSHNGGDTFMGPIPISESGVPVAAYGEASPSLAFSRTEIYALWQQTNARSTQLMCARSVDWGHSFERPVSIIDKSKPSFNGFSSIAVAPDGDLYAVWLDGRDRQPPVPDSVDPEGTFSVYLARSTDQGASFGKNVRVAFGACPCCRPTLAFGSHGEVFVAWRKVFPGDIRDMVVATSYDHGRTFSKPVRVARDHWKIPGCPDSGPSLAVQGNRLYVAWFSDGDNKPGIRLSHSTDGARSFTKPLIVSETVLDPNHPDLSVSEDGAVLLVFQGRDPEKNEGWSYLSAYLVRISGTDNTTPPLKLPDGGSSVSYPVVTSDTTRQIFLAWTDTTNTATNVEFLRGRRRR
jgi:hypothetical protein